MKSYQHRSNIRPLNAEWPKIGKVHYRVRAKNSLSLHAPLGLGLRGEQEREFFVPKTKPGKTNSSYLIRVLAKNPLSLHASN